MLPSHLNLNPSSQSLESLARRGTGTALGNEVVCRSAAEGLAFSRHECLGKPANMSASNFFPQSQCAETSTEVDSNFSRIQSEEDAILRALFLEIRADAVKISGVFEDEKYLVRKASSEHRDVMRPFNLIDPLISTKLKCICATNVHPSIKIHVSCCYP
jgi:hypothetical protein